MEDDFEQWFLANGGYIDPNVELARNEITGRHMRVVEGGSLKSDTIIISCPHELTISWLNVVRGSETFLSQFELSDACYAVNQVVIVRFFVINEYLKREHSFWWPYFKSLPQPTEAHLLGTPLYYDDQDWLWIRGTNLEHAARKTERMWRMEYDEAMQSLVPLDGSHAAGWSWPLYKWAATIMSSRCFPASALANSTLVKNPPASEKSLLGDSDDTIEAGSPILIPGIDLLNHCPSVKVTWQWTSSSCRLMTNEPLETGAQVMNNYGQKSNEELILGYGFSVANNAADHCGLATLAGADRQQHGLDSQTVSNRELEIPQPISKTRNLDLRRETIHWVRLRNSVVDKIPKHAEPSYEFSPGFLPKIATALTNQREKAAGSNPLDGQIDFSSKDLSRSKLKVMATVLMLLQRQLVNIRSHDTNLPQWPENERQFHAARYRRGQLHILQTVSTLLLDSLSALVSLNGSIRDLRIVRLEHMLADSPHPLLKDYRAALNAGLGTRKATKIRERGWVECAFTIWICGVWLWGRSVGESFPDDSLEAKLCQWLHFLQDTYPNSSVGNGDEQVIDKEDSLLVDSFHGVTQAAAQKHPASLFSSPECTKQRIQWCLDVAREESVMCPNFEGEAGDENDELVLFMEC